MEKVVVPFADLPLLVSPSRGPIAGRHLFEGSAFGLAHLTVVIGESHPGQGVPLNRHDCEELIVVHAGRGTYTVGETTAEAGAGEVVVIPAGVPHRWVNHTEDPLVHTAAFPTDRFALEELADERRDERSDRGHVEPWRRRFHFRSPTAHAGAPRERGIDA